MKRIVAILAALIVACFTPLCAHASTLALPAGLTAIEDEAFAGDTVLTEIILPDALLSIGDAAFSGCASIGQIAIPDSVESIGENAFSGCASLGWITIPGSVSSIGSGALDGCQPDLLVRTAYGSAAMEYAQMYGIDYQANTHYRALLIAQSYENVSSLATLAGTTNDVSAMATALPCFADSAYSVTIRRDLSASGILSAIQSAFSGAGEQDVSLFYYSGHGLSSSNSTKIGALVGTSTSDVVTAAQLRSALDAIPGRKIVIIDACYSGNFITQNFTSRAVAQADDSVQAEAATADGGDFVDAFISAFAMRSRSASSSNEFFILVAAADDQKSYEAYITGNSGPTMGLFTRHLLVGAGYKLTSQTLSSTRPADVNSNNVLTLDELYQYAYTKVINTANLPSEQHAQVYPVGCDWFGVFRG